MYGHFHHRGICKGLLLNGSTRDWNQSGADTEPPHRVSNSLAVLHHEADRLLGAVGGGLAPPQQPIVQYHDFIYQAATWDKTRRVAAKVE